MNLLRGLRLSASRPAQGFAGSSRLYARLGAVRPLHAGSRPSSALLGEGGVLRMRTSPSSTPVRVMLHSLEERDEQAGEERVARFRHIYDKLARGKLISKKDLKHGIEQTLSYSVTDEQIDRMMRMADLDDSGSIDFREFQVLFEDIQDDAISLEGLAEYWLGFSEVVKDPAMIFQAAWRRLSALVDGEQNIRLPHEIMFLGGAPGAGKGTMTPYVMWERGITAKPIVMSSVLNSPSAQKIINAGGLVGDMEVFTMLLQELSQPERRHGTLVDGFPRTVMQVQLLQLLYEALTNLSRKYDGTPLASEFRRPRFRMCILYVDEPTSIERQLSRGRQALEHNKHVDETGEGDAMEVRETDLSVKAARHRYRLFVDGTMAANEALKQTFPFNLINAAGTIEEVRQVVMQELSYQSSLELQEDTYNAIKHIPTAADISKRARQNLVSRLDSYQFDHQPVFAAVIRIIETDVLPTVLRHALVGEARVTCQSPRHAVFSQPLALDMMVDVMYDRGFSVSAEDRGNGSFHFKVYFAPPEFHNAAGTADRGFSAKNGGMDARDVLLPSSAGSTKEAALPDSRSSRQHAEE